MTKTKSTKRALLMSALALILCVSMLVGSTFAWFTDSVTTAGTTIQSGTLDVDLVDDAGNSLEGKSIKFKDLDQNALWEPGCTYETEPVYVVNKGNLALKYTVAINGIVGDAKLLEAIEWTTTGSLEGELKNKGDKSDAIVLTGHMKEEAGNEYQGLKVEGISFTVLATQLAHEFDSNGNDYDEKAPLLVWDGSVDTSWYDAAATEYELASPARLAGLAKLVNEGNSFAGKNLKLAADMDLANIAWTPIGNATHNFNGNFYGNGFKIYNLNVTGTKGVGLFGFAGNAAHIEGVHVIGANVSGVNSVGTVLGYGYLAANCLKNCTVEDAVVYAAAGASKEDGDKVGAVAGWTSNGNIIGNKAIDCEIYGCRDIGGIVGYANGENRAITISGNTVEEVTVNVIKADGYKKELGSNVNDTVGRTGSRVTVQGNSGKIEKIADVAAASNTEDLKAAVANGGEVTVAAGTYSFPTSSIKEDTVLNCKPGTVFNGQSGLDIKGATVVGAEFSNENGNAVRGTINGVFKNCVFDGSNGLRWCYAGETVVFEDCIFSGDVYGAHFDGGANEVVFRRCTFSGFNAIGGAITLATYEDCTFKANGRSGYNGINMWGNTNMTGCTFVFDGTAHTEWVDACGDNKTYSFTNCVVTDGTDKQGVEAFVGDYGANNVIKVDGKPVVFNNDALKAAVAGGATEIMLRNGEYDLNGIQNNGLTLVGVDSNVKVANTTKYASGKATGAIWKAIRLKNVTVTNTVYTMAEGSDATFTNVNFAAGFRQGYGKNIVFTDCTFGANSEGYALHFQTDSASADGTIKLTGCEFEGGNVHLGGKRAYVFTGCDFAAGTDFQVWSTVTLSGCTVDGTAVTAENAATLFPKLDLTKVTIQ
ncbi:MAG: hypothetical protein IJC84_06385 [Clostridia bacterium]|nr:hypothetical protein [Clostridia bacterium]